MERRATRIAMLRVSPVREACAPPNASLQAYILSILAQQKFARIERRKAQIAEARVAIEAENRPVEVKTEAAAAREKAARERRAFWAHFRSKYPDPKVRRREVRRARMAYYLHIERIADDEAALAEIEEFIARSNGERVAGRV